MVYLRPINQMDVQRIYTIKSNPLNFNKRFTKFDTGGVTLESIKDFVSNITNEANAVRLGICCQENHTLVGCITIGEIDYVTSYCEIHIYIDNSYQNRGIGRRSLELLIEYINRILKLRTISLSVHKEHLKALHLYETLGFSVYTTGPNDDFINMRLTM